MISLVFLGVVIAYSPMDYEYYVVFGLMLPTLFHVSLFTAAFMLLGALKSRSVQGLAAFAAFVFCSTVICLPLPGGSAYPADSTLFENYQLTLGVLSQTLLQILSVDKSDHVVLNSTLGIRMLRFIAFAYTYHYLNWFSKTSIIGWHHVSSRRLMVVCGLWCVSVASFAYDYRLGLLCVSWLGLLHVFLEFPLNWLSFIGIPQELKSIAKSGWSASRPVQGHGTVAKLQTSNPLRRGFNRDPIRRGRM
jgi:hypothetical protein